VFRLFAMIEEAVRARSETLVRTLLESVRIASISLTGEGIADQVAFLTKRLKGWGFAIDNPAKTVKDLKATFPNMNEKLATAALAAITPLSCSGGAKYLGKAEEALWAKTQDLLSQVKLLPAGQDPKSYYTYDYLPPVSEMRPCK